MIINGVPAGPVQMRHSLAVNALRAGGMHRPHARHTVAVDRIQ